MKKSDLKTGMIVETRGRRRYIVLLETGLPGRENNILCNKDGWNPLSSYDEDMKNSIDRGFDIVRVWKPEIAAYVGRITNCKLVEVADFHAPVSGECVFDL